MALGILEPILCALMATTVKNKARESLWNQFLQGRNYLNTGNRLQLKPIAKWSTDNTFLISHVDYSQKRNFGFWVFRTFTESNPFKRSLQQHNCMNSITANNFLTGFLASCQDKRTCWLLLDRQLLERCWMSPCGSMSQWDLRSLTSVTSGKHHHNPPSRSISQRDT